MDIVLGLENIRSAENVGAIFRTAEAVGVSRICLIGYTPTPVDRFGRARRDIGKAALGAETLVPWEHYETAHAFCTAMQNEKRMLIVLEQDERAVEYTNVPRTERAALILGNEVDGVSDTLRDAADVLISIPMHGKKESLNVSVAAGIALYALIDTTRR